MSNINHERLNRRSRVRARSLEPVGKVSCVVDNPTNKWDIQEAQEQVARWREQQKKKSARYAR